MFGHQSCDREVAPSALQADAPPGELTLAALIVDAVLGVIRKGNVFDHIAPALAGISSRSWMNDDVSMITHPG